MNAKFLGIAMAGAALMLVAVQQFRIGQYRERITDLENQVAATGGNRTTPAGSRRREMPPSGSKTGARPVATAAGPASPSDTSEEPLVTSLRRMSENPAGRAMMNQGIKAMSAMWFADLVDQFGLTREEEDYFLRLVAGGMSSQQNIGMKMMTAKSDEERETLKEEIEQARQETTEAVRDFLNNEEDFAAYELYNKQLPERQQLEGLRNTMLEAGAPLTREQENQVIAAMFKVRTTRSGATDWQGGGGMEAIASGKATETFEREWDEIARATAEEVGKTLEGAQLEAFKQYQAQMKEMQLMSIKMAEKMFQPGEDAPAGDE